MAAYCYAQGIDMRILIGYRGIVYEQTDRLADSVTVHNNVVGQSSSVLLEFFEMVGNHIAHVGNRLLASFLQTGVSLSVQDLPGRKHKRICTGCKV
jgi:hypothetical protein